nr:hypothetical protein BaRGS_028935 [Batillaria attramentaria]
MSGFKTHKFLMLFGFLLWQLVLFSDESRFLVKPRDGRIRVWRCPGEQLADDAVQEVTAFGGGSVMRRSA